MFSFEKWDVFGSKSLLEKMDKKASQEESIIIRKEGNEGWEEMRRRKERK